MVPGLREGDGKLMFHGDNFSFARGDDGDGCTMQMPLMPLNVHLERLGWSVSCAFTSV